ncbi:hypothetical protein BC826DRAFT_481668 [Russula brevipes]|nr:hypothetical protein BC826DRAFT_481668 [Russula brevipes]
MMNLVPFARPQSMSQASLRQSAKQQKRRIAPRCPRRLGHLRLTPPVNSGSPSKVARRTFDPTPEGGGDRAESPDAASPTKSSSNRGPPRAIHGTMDREFMFPSTTPIPEADTAVLHDQRAAGSG